MFYVQQNWHHWISCHFISSNEPCFMWGVVHVSLRYIWILSIFLSGSTSCQIFVTMIFGINLVDNWTVRWEVVTILEANDDLGIKIRKTTWILWLHFLLRSILWRGNKSTNCHWYWLNKGMNFDLGMVAGESQQHHQ